MSGVKCGVELVRRLRESGTPDGKLTAARAELERVYKAEKRKATADEVLSAMQESGVSGATLRKARQLIERGEITKSEQVKPIEDVLAEVDDKKPAVKPQPALAGGVSK